MNESVWVLIAFIAITLLSIYVNYLVTLHGRVRRLEHRASPRLEIIEREVHGIGCYMRIIIGIAIFFCVCVSVHYLCFCHPKFFSDGAPKPDALGTVVAIFGIIITLLVGWQIYNTIKAKEELEKAIKTIKGQYDKDIKAMKDDISQLKKSETENAIQQAEQKGIDQANEVDKGFVEFNLSKEVMDAIDNQMQIQGTMLYAWAYNVADEYKTFKQIFNEFKAVQLKHPKRVAYIGGRQATDEKATEVIKIARNDKLKLLESIRAMRSQTDKDNGDA